jgi:hypothetical protein
VCWLEKCILEGSKIEEDRFPALAFEGLKIAVTQLPQKERTEIQLIVEAHGGVYYKDLHKDECTHLVAVTPEGEKYDAVKHSKSIRVMRCEWIYACRDAKSNLVYVYSNIVKTS